jgi:hypothetical protein
MTATALEFLTFIPQQKFSSSKEKEKSKNKLNEDPRMKEFVNNVIAMQANGNIFLATGNFETEEEYKERRNKILQFKF